MIFENQTTRYPAFALQASKIEKCSSGQPVSRWVGNSMDQMRKSAVELLAMPGIAAISKNGPALSGINSAAS